MSRIIRLKVCVMQFSDIRLRRIKIHPPVKLVIGLIYHDDSVLAQAFSRLKKAFGSIDFESNTLAFDQTDYYQQEFGKGLKRKFIGFGRLILPQQLAGIKKKTNQIELGLSLHGRRRVNIDPGYLELSKLTLATTKDFRHRVYIGGGIFAEVTLYYRGKTFQPWEWTYPDYRTQGYIDIFNQLREIYRSQLRQDG
jgi:hypothetical protein